MQQAMSIFIHLLILHSSIYITSSQFSYLEAQLYSGSALYLSFSSGQTELQDIYIANFYDNAFYFEEISLEFWDSTIEGNKSKLII